MITAVSCKLKESSLKSIRAPISKERKTQLIIFTSAVPQWLVLNFAMSLLQNILHTGPKHFQYFL